MTNQTTTNQTKMMLATGLVLTWLAWSSAAWAQTATPSSRLGWDQAETDAPTLTYLIRVDGDTPTVLQDVTCTPTTPPDHACSAAWPGMQPGAHDVTITARRTVEGEALDSLPSAPLAVTFVVLPAVPRNLRVEPQ